MAQFTFYVTESGRLPQGIASTLTARLKELAGKKCTIKLEEASSSTSDKQRRYYFGVIVEDFIKYFISQHQHFTKEQMHDSMMRSIGGFNKPFVNPFTGEPDDGRISYNDLTTAQAEGYHTLCLKWAAEKGFQIALPHEDLTMYR